MKFRYSEIQTYYKCPKLYEYKYIMELPDGSDKSADLLFGTAIHLALQDVFEGGNGIDCFNIFWTDSETKSLEYGRLPHRDLEFLGQTFIERFIRLHKKHFEPSYIEAKMEYNNPNGMTFQGTADMIGMYKGKMSIIDYKTAAYPYDHYKIECNEQMYNYANLAHKVYGIMPEQLVYIVFVKNVKEPRIQVIIKDLNTKKLNDMIDNMINVCTDITHKQMGISTFTRNPSGCIMGKSVCPFFTRCFPK